MAKRFVMFSIIAVLLTTGCGNAHFIKSGNFELQPGDLLFQDLDSGPLCDAIEKVTNGYQGYNFSHIGIITKNDTGNFAVIEAIQDGVVVTSLKSFLNRSFDAKGHPRVIVGRLKEPYRSLIPEALHEAHNLEGKPYDKVFEINNDSYYCSELIYEIFRKANNNDPVFTLQPMTFKDPDTRNTFPAWETYFSDLSVPVPEGQPGLNPGGISLSDALTIVYSYGEPSKKYSLSPEGND